MSENQPECAHVNLQKLAGPLHPNGKDYRCTGCGQMFRAEELVIEEATFRPHAADCAASIFVNEECDCERGIRIAQLESAQPAKGRG